MTDMETLHLHQNCTGIVEGYTSEGQGVVKINGAVVFVPGAVRGEEVEIEITKVMKSAAAGKITRVIKPSPFRREPDCPYFGRCGGCDFRHVSYEEELAAKRRRVQDALTRLGGADVEVEHPPLPLSSKGDGREKSLGDNVPPFQGGQQVECREARRPLRYRNKSQFPVGADGAIGFYEARSHRVVPVSDCLLQPSAANRTAAAVRRWMERYHVPAYDERSGKGLIRHVYARTNAAGESLCCVIANGKRLPKEPELVGLLREAVPEAAGVILNANTRRDNVILGESFRTIWGQAYLLDTLRVPGVERELAFRLSVPSFYQVNREAAQILYGKALDFAALTGRENVLDLYCGIGTLTLCLARKAGRVLGAEIVPRAVEDANGNAARNGITNAAFVCVDAAEIAAQLAGRLVSAAEKSPAEPLPPEIRDFHPDVITVDPPRKGLTPEGIAAIASMEPARIVYLSCDPGTLGRDVKRFAERGYQAVRAAAVDLFPGTRHIETAALLKRNGNGAR